MRLTDDTLCFSSGHSLSAQTAHPPNLKFQDLEGVTHWLNNEGKICFIVDFVYLYIECYPAESFRVFPFLCQPLDTDLQRAVLIAAAAASTA